ncbi:GFM1 [Cordylochernes scorpioides]|uniref:GFM1 n=1 Tax=Cordylochernes scorpioides TaxID=51811 RepID=A0ABY6K9Y2_9ARAC|nr:GFM1 [Cordylochernes scorpioides]
MDSMELERQRGITIQSATTQVNWKKHTINIIDTPGHVDFTVEVERALRVLDSAILVLCAVGGVQCQTMTVNRQIKRHQVPFLAFINKMDRVGANHLSVAEQIKDKLNQPSALVQIPIGTEKDFKGVIDLVHEKAYYFDGECGERVKVTEPPAELKEEMSLYKSALLETIANYDGPFMDRYLGESDVPIGPEEIMPCTECVQAAIRRLVVAREFVPIFLGSALKNKAVQPLLDGVLNYLPNPMEVHNYACIYHPGREEPERLELKTQRENVPPVALAFKLETKSQGQLTYLRVYQGTVKVGHAMVNTRTKQQVAIKRLVRMHSDKMRDITEAYAGDICAMVGLDCASGDTFVGSRELLNLANILHVWWCQENIMVPEPVIYKSIKLLDSNRMNQFSKAMARFTKEDPSFHMEWNDECKETIVSGMGELHLEIYGQRLEKEYNVPVELGKPKVSYRETLKEPIEFDYLHKKQSGGAGQYGRVCGILEPLAQEHNTKVLFSDETSGTNVPKKFVPAIEKGFKESCEKGFYSGNKISGVKFRLQDGDNHCVDSNDISFMLAAKGAIRQTYEYGKWRVLEPIMIVMVTVPPEHHGSAMQLLSSRKGRIHGTEAAGDDVNITALVPLSEMFNFSPDLRSQTQGKGEYSMEYSHYQPCTQDLENRLVAEHKDSLEQGIKNKKKKKK